MVQKLSRRQLGISAGLLSAAACTARINNAKKIEPLRPGEKHAPITLDMWSFHTGPEAQQVQKVLDRLHKAYPWLTVRLVQGKQDFDVLQGIYSGHPPDIAVLAGPANVAKFTSIGAMPDLNELARKDGIDLAKVIPKSVMSTATYQGKTCVLPWLTDAYGLYYNKKLFAEAGISRLPRSLDELEATAKKLTTFNSDGSIKTAGFVPLSTFYHSEHMDQGPCFGGAWYRHGHCAVATDPRWAQGLTWQKKYIDSVGHGKLSRFAADIGLNSEYTPKNGFEIGKIAMILDGEWRVGYLERESKVDFGTAPFPTLDPKNYGSGQIGGTMISLPATARDPAASWVAVKYLALDTGALNQIADGLQNVPTTFESLKTAAYCKKPANRAFVNILNDPRSLWKQAIPAGQVDLDLMGQFVQSYEAG
ncbi:MAG TPA: extracellular solute-binding protein, partial [Mycobacteriales bacterium]|nr:extracellular solute-binding protein [Mycobacteriales bacterium]